MIIRHSKEEDLPRMMEIYAYARDFMAEHGNPNQWGPTNWPPEDLIRADIAAGNSYVCVCKDRVAGAFFFQQGRDIEPTYRTIEDGGWLDDGPYGVVHRLAGDGSVKGIGSACLEWAFGQCGHLRIESAEKERLCILRDHPCGGGLLPEAGVRKAPDRGRPEALACRNCWFMRFCLMRN